jgi:hypothetical protein
MNNEKNNKTYAFSLIRILGFHDWFVNHHLISRSYSMEPIIRPQFTEQIGETLTAGIDCKLSG